MSNQTTSIFAWAFSSFKDHCLKLFEGLMHKIKLIEAVWSTKLKLAKIQHRMVML